MPRLKTPPANQQVGEFLAVINLPAATVFRSQLILMLEGACFNTIKRRLQISAPTIIRWKQRFLESRYLSSRPEGDGSNSGLAARILSATRKKPNEVPPIGVCRKPRIKPNFLQDFLQRHPRMQFHFTPTYSSWLSQVELWFVKIEREVIARGIFIQRDSPLDLLCLLGKTDKVMRTCRTWN